MFETQKVRRILEDLDAKDKRVRANALKQLKDNPRLIEALGTLLKDTRKYVFLRQNAATALGLTEDPRAVEPLIAALRDPWEDVRNAAATALERIKDPRTTELLQTAALREPGSSRALDILIQMGDTHAIRPLIQLAVQNKYSPEYATEKLGGLLERSAKNATLDDLQVAAALGSITVQRVSWVCSGDTFEEDIGLQVRQLARQELLRRERENGSEHVQEYKSESKQNLDPERAAAQTTLLQLLQIRAGQLTAEMPKPKPRSTDGKQDHELEREEAALTLIDWLALTSHDDQAERESK
jgi:hypothetical protein